MADTKKVFSASDAAPIVLYAKRDGDSEKTYPLIASDEGYLRIVDISSSLKMRLDYDVRTDGQPVYQGFAPSGLAEGENGWLIYKFTYDVSNNMTQRDVYGASAEDSGNWIARVTGSYVYD